MLLYNFSCLIIIWGLQQEFYRNFRDSFKNIVRWLAQYKCNVGLIGGHETIVQLHIRIFENRFKDQNQKKEGEREQGAPKTDERFNAVYRHFD